MTVAALIVAAGRGHRLGAEMPKQYIPLAGKCPLRLSVEVFLQVAEVTSLLTVIHPDDAALYDEAMDGVTDPRLLAPVTGGATRAASVRSGLERLAETAPSHVLIHDAARPFVSTGIIRNVIDALGSHDGAFAALPVVDALWSSRGDLADEPVPRDGLWRAQTPQGFDYAKIRATHATHDGTGADDVAVARDAGLSVKLILGSEANYKITTAADLERARRDVKTEPSV